MSLKIPSDLEQGNPNAATKEHEFDIMQNEVFGGLAGWMGFVGIMIIIFGSLYCVQGVLNMSASGMIGMIGVGQGVCLLLIGGWTWSASRSFKQIVTTEGMDITLLMDAMKKLRSVYTLQGILLIIVILLIVGLIFLMSGTSLRH
jgi:hypothetical protein